VKLPKDLIAWELRAKQGRKHVVVFQFFQTEGVSWSWRPRERIIGPVRWYVRRRGSRWQPFGEWLDYW